jgi:RNA-directed DNA polymerase
MAESGTPSRCEGIDEKIRAKLTGHYRYYGITDNDLAMSVYKFQISKTLLKWLNRRSQRRSFTSDKFNFFLERNPLPEPLMSFAFDGERL